MGSDVVDAPCSSANRILSMKGDERLDCMLSGVLDCVGCSSDRWSKECFAAFKVEVSVLPFDIRFEDDFDCSNGAENGRGTGFADSGRLEDPAGLVSGVTIEWPSAGCLTG